MSPQDVTAALEIATDDVAPQFAKPERRPLVASIWSKIETVSNRLDQKFPFTLSLQVIAFILVMSWFVLLLPLRISSIADPDLGWHLRSGEWIMQNHRLPLTDPFSITGDTAPWVAYSWSFSVLIFEFAKNFDLQGLAAYSTLAWILTSLAIFIFVRGRGAGYWKAIGLTFVVGNIMPRVISPRPGTITTLLFIATLHILLTEREKGYTRVLWVLPAIICVWANVHVQFVYGLFILGVFCVEPILDRLFLVGGEPQKFSLRLWAVLLVSTFATLLNPYGFGPYQVIIDFLHQPLLAILVAETNAMNFQIHVHYIVLLLTLGSAFAMARRKPIRPLWVVLVLWAAISAFRMERDVWVLATICVGLIATPTPTSKTPEPVHPRVWLYGTVGLLIATLLTLKLLPPNKYMVSLLARELPVGAVAYVHEHKLTGPLFNDYDWGGFLIYALPEIKVAIDGRTNVHGQDEVARSFSSWALRPGWDRDPLLNSANLVIGNPNKALTIYLEQDPHFKTVFNDGVGVVLQRVQPGSLATVPTASSVNSSKTTSQ